MTETAFSLPKNLRGARVALRAADLSAAPAHVDYVRESWDLARRWLDYAYDCPEPPAESVLRRDLASWQEGWQDFSLKPGRFWHYHIFQLPGEKLAGLISLSVDGAAPLRLRMHYAVRPSLNGQGIATEAARLLAEELGKKAELAALVLSVEEGNHASRRVAEKAGFALAPSLTTADKNYQGAIVPFHGYMRLTPALKTSISES